MIDNRSGDRLQSSEQSALKQQMFQQFENCLLEDATLRPGESLWHVSARLLGYDTGTQIAPGANARIHQLMDLLFEQHIRGDGTIRLSPGSRAPILEIKDEAMLNAVLSNCAAKFCARQ